MIRKTISIFVIRKCRQFAPGSVVSVVYHLDFGNRIRVMQTVRSLIKDGYCVIQSTHDPEQAYMYSDNILALHAGQVLAWGKPAETVTADVISKLYSIEVEVCSLRGDDVRVCVPAHGKEH